MKDLKEKCCWWKTNLRMLQSFRRELKGTYTKEEVKIKKSQLFHTHVKKQIYNNQKAFEIYG